jgi:O-antigen ligase
MSAWTLPDAYRLRLIDAADYLAIALLVSLPWSTSGTDILAVLWLVTLLPTLDWTSVRRTLVTPAGGLPALLLALFVLGMLWADVSWRASLDGCSSYLKLAVIPFLLIQFRRSQRGLLAIYFLLAACIALLAASYFAVTFPTLIPWQPRNHGVVVKDYFSQSGFFTIAAFLLFEFAYLCWRDGRHLLAYAGWILAALFLANIFFVVSSRTTFFVVAVLILLYGLRRAGWKGLLTACLIGALLAASAWATSPYLRQRVESVLVKKERGLQGGLGPSSTVLRLAFWKASFEIVKEAPIIGHGTGTIHANFARYAAGHANSYVDRATNPHNQTFAVAIQLGLMGTVVLYAMWLFHFLLFFRKQGMIAWFGIVVVVQNFVGSLFNSHLMDFTQGWTYVVLVGVAGGIILRRSQKDSDATAGAEA